MLPSPPAAPPPPPAWPASTPLSGRLASGTHTLLRASISYTLTDTLVVGAGATLEIEPGSTIGVAPSNSAGVYAGGPTGGGSLSANALLDEFERRGTPRTLVWAVLQQLDANSDCAVDASEWGALSGTAGDLVSAYLGSPTLVVERGGRLLAHGTADAPITFAVRRNSTLLGDTDAVAAHEAWGGLVVMGNAPTAAGTALSGCLGSGTIPAEAYGGNDALDTSGVLRYVRVWHARRGLALHGVGQGSTVDHIEVLNSATDGIVLHGGTVAVSRLSSLGAADTGFRVRAGFGGRAQFLFAMLGATGRAGLSLAPAHALEAYATSPPLSPTLFSITILGGGSAGSSAAASASLVELGDGGGATGHGATGHGAIGDVLVMHGSGHGIELPATLALAQAHPPPPPFTAYSSTLVHESSTCGLQAADGISEGVWLGQHATADECAQAAGEYRERNVTSPNDSDCLTFQHSTEYPVFGCMCCYRASGGQPHSLWNVYATTPNISTSSAASGGGAAASALYVAPSMIVHSVAGSPNISLSGTTAALASSSADPGLIDVSADCLTLSCVRNALACAAAFDPLPSAHGAACVTHVDADAMRYGGDGGAIEPVSCAGAFGSWEASANWLAGWSSLFPLHVGEAPRSADGLTVASDSVRMTLSTGFLAQSAAVAARKADELQRLQVRFAPEMCSVSAFSPDADAHANAPVYWLLLRPLQSGLLHLSTCSTERNVGFDTDLALLNEPLAGSSGACMAPEQMACNGDSFGEANCQVLYSALSASVVIGRRYLVALKGHQSSAFGDNVTITAWVGSTPPPSAPPPPLPPPAPQIIDLQLTIDNAPISSAPVLINLGTVTELTGTVTVPAGRRVVVRGTNSTSTRAIVRPGGGSFRLFDVEDGGELYLSNLQLEAGAGNGCGGAVRVRGRGSLVAQFCRFERNRAAKGGAICVEGDGRLQLVAVNISGNTATHGVGANVYLGRPLTAFSNVDLLGVCAANLTGGCDVPAQGSSSSSSSSSSSDVSAAPLPFETDTLWFSGVWTTASCLSDMSCIFHVTDRFEPPPFAQCAPLTTGGDAYGVHCACIEGFSGADGLSDEQRALTPYGTAPVDALIGVTPHLRCRNTLDAIFLAASRLNDELEVSLRKGGPSEPRARERSAVNITMGLQGTGLFAEVQHVHQVYAWALRSAHRDGFGEHQLASCMTRSLTGALSAESAAALEFDTNDTCHVPVDGSLLLFDGELGRSVKLVDTYGGTGPILADAPWFMSSQLKIPIAFSAVDVRETDERDSYNLPIEVVMPLDDGAERTNLTLRVTVTAQAVASQCTLVPFNATEVVEDGAAVSGCVCQNTCASAPRDGVCDDGGPGNDFSLCALGTDCADCGSRAGPPDAFAAFDLYHSELEPADAVRAYAALMANLTANLTASQIDTCLTERTRTILCDAAGDSGCTRLGLEAPMLGSSCKLDADAWVPNSFSVSLWTLGLDQQCGALFPDLVRARGGWNLEPSVCAVSYMWD